MLTTVRWALCFNVCLPFRPAAMLTLLVIGMTCLTASVSGEADPQFFYNPGSYFGNSYYYPTYPTYQPAYQPAYNPFLYHPAYYYPTMQAPKAALDDQPEPEIAKPEKEDKHQSIRNIVPFFTTPFIRGAAAPGAFNVQFAKPAEGEHVKPEEQAALTYTVPYTQALLNRIPAAYYA